MPCVPCFSDSSQIGFRRGLAACGLLFPRPADWLLCMRTKVICKLLFIGAAAASRADVAVLAQHNDPALTGANLDETRLNVKNVNTNHFGLAWSLPVDDQIYAQPLVMTNVLIPAKGRHNLVLVATVNDSIYAFDADDPLARQPYWQVSLLKPGVVPPRNADMFGACSDFTDKYQDFSGNIGIVGTPVIDPASSTIYLVARTKEAGRLKPTFAQRLHALDVATGAERPHSPVAITASCQGDGDGNINGLIEFDPLRQSQRAGLALIEGTVMIGWASHCDWRPYHGWLMGYDAHSLKRILLYNTTPDGSCGGIWMSGAPPSADSEGNIYVAIGNGSVGVRGDPGDRLNRGESLVKLTRHADTLRVASWFTPWNWEGLEAGDIDFGSTGVLLIPGTRLALVGSKEGKLYLANRDHLGGMSRSNADTNIVQSFQVTDTEPPNNIHSTPVWWNGPSAAFAYVWGESDYLRQYQFNQSAGRFLLPEVAKSPAPAPKGMPGGFLSLSADGASAGTGILWASHPSSGDANRQTRPGILHAYNAENVGEELWNSEQNRGRDAVGNFAKFCPPTVANGKVYLATFSKRLDVYGLREPVH